MKSLKKTLVLLVVFSMILSTLVPAFAATDVDGLECEDQVTRMEALGIIAGFEDGSFRPTETITRAQMAVIICKMTGVTDAIAEANRYVASKFSDVAAGEWYTGYVNIASNNGIITGFPDGTFRPNETLTLNQVLTLCVKALGRGGYVDKMGTWPANYIAEAARLNLLKDVKGASDANRGNVAVICWNTLNSKKWGVTGEEIDGVNYGDKEEVKTLLAIYFPGFVYEGKNEVFTKEAEGLTITAVPSTKTTIGDRQVVLAYDKFTTDGWNNFVKSFEKKSGDKKTYINGTEVVAYIPENVYADVDSLLGKEVTILFGEDNVVAVIEITNDSTFDSAYVEKYANDKVTIDGTDYTFADRAVVTVNTLVKTNDSTNAKTVMTELLTNIGEDDNEEFVKLVKANVILNSDEEISRLDLSLSGSYDAYCTFEAIATKNRNDELTYYYFYKDGDNVKSDKATFDYEELTSKKMPKVYKNNEAIDITDIEANDVLTVYYGENKTDLKIIYVSDKTVAGEVTKTYKPDTKVYVDGTSYTASMKKLLTTNKEASKGGYVTGDIGTNVKKKDDVTAYLNIYGEYVVISTESESTGNYTIGYVIATKGADADGDTLTMKIRVLLPDGTKPWYTVIGEEDEDLSFDDVDDLAESLKNKIIAFETNSDNEIDYEDETDVIVLANVTDASAGTMAAENITDDKYFDFNSKYDIEKLGGSVAVNDSKNKLGEYRFKEGKTLVIDLKAAKVTSKWNSILKNDAGTDKLVADAITIFDEGETTIKYMFIYSTETSTSDVMYAVVSDISDDDALLLTDDGESTLEYSSEFSSDGLGNEKGFVVYKTNSRNKIKDAKMLVDVDAFNELTANKKVAFDTEYIVFKDEIFGVGLKIGTDDLTKVTKEHFEVDALDTDIYELSYKEDVTTDLSKIPAVDLEADATVYDLRDGKFVVGDLDDLATILKTESVYVIPFANGEGDGYANILVILD